MYTQIVFTDCTCRTNSFSWLIEDKWDIIEKKVPIDRLFLQISSTMIELSKCGRSFLSENFDLQVFPRRLQSCNIWVLIFNYTLTLLCWILLDFAENKENLLQSCSVGMQIELQDVAVGQQHFVLAISSCFCVFKKFKRRVWFNFSHCFTGRPWRQKKNIFEFLSVLNHNRTKSFRSNCRLISFYHILKKSRESRKCCIVERGCSLAWQILFRNYFRWCRKFAVDAL